MSELTKAKRIERAQRVRDFLADEYVSEALRRMEAENHKAFLSADTDEARRNAWAEARALERFSAKLAGMMGDGDRARDEIRREAPRSPTPEPPQ